MGPKVVKWLLAVMGVMICVEPSWAQPSPVLQDSPPDAHVLVQRLGDPRFSVRERATNDLVQLGSDAIDALDDGCQSTDREVQFRSRRVLEIVREYDFQRRLEAFAGGTDATDGGSLPGWERFRYEVGEDRPARMLFVEMQKCEPQLLRLLEESPGKIADALALRVMEIQSSLQYERDGSPLDLGTVTTILFICNSTKENSDLRTAQAVTYFLKQASFTNALRVGSERELLRKMLGQWIERSEGWTAYQGLVMALQYNIPSGLVTAKRLLKETPDPNLAYARYYALLAMARFGTDADLELIESFLDDTTPYGATVQVNSQVKFRPQIRDVALAALVHLTKQKFSDYGFDRLRMEPIFVFDMNTIAFENDEKRAEAIQHWRDGRAKDPTKAPNPSDS